MSIELKVPSVGESINEIEIGDWLKKEGDPIKDGETVAILESEKATVDLPSPATGILKRILKARGQVAAVGEVIAEIAEASETAAASNDSPPASARSAGSPAEPEPEPDRTEASHASNAPTENSPNSSPHVMPAAARVLAEGGLPPESVLPTGPGNRILKEDALRAVAETSAPAEASPPTSDTTRIRNASSKKAAVANDAAAAAPSNSGNSDRLEDVVRMSKLRRTVAARLVSAKQDMALLTTFNEIDMGTVMALRKDMQEAFTQQHGIKLGFMSFFIKAVIDALKRVPQLNAEIRDDNIVFKNYYDIGVAIGGGKGLVVPVLRNAERMGFAQIEKAIIDFATRARDGKLKPDELDGGTFTISNGGVYGSLLSTPIVSPPQSGVLGMHTIQERPVVRDGQIVIRPMMYVALTYDHRIVDGREAVGFVKRIKDVIENPSRILLEA